MSRTWSVGFAVATALCGCASTKEKSDDLCANLRQFASTVPAGQIRSVTLRGGWGGDSPETLVTHSCEHTGYGPGALFCAYLVPNTSWEFGQYNAKRAAACLAAHHEKDFLAALDQFKEPAELQGTLVTAAGSAATVTLRFEPADVSKLIISVGGAKP